jgi:tetratricopeptide (TPR) repeat protein
MASRRLWNAFLSKLPMRKKLQHRREREATISRDDQEDTLNELLLNRFEDVMGRIADDHLLQLEVLSHYATLKIEEFQRKGKMEDLEEAISKQLQAVEGTTEGHPDLAGRQSQLGNMLEKRFERTGRMEDLEEAIRRTRQAVDVIPENHPNLAVMLNSLGNKFRRRFKRTGRMEDLENNLGNKLWKQFERMGKMEDPEYNLGNKLWRRFERMGRMEDLEEAIRRVQQAVNITPEGHSHLAMHLNNLGNMLESRFVRSGKTEDLEEAICKQLQAVEGTTEGPSLAIYLTNLGNKLWRRFERTGRMEDLEEAIRRAQQAVNITPEDHPNLAAMLNNLGSKLRSRFEMTGRMEDLEKAIRRTQQAVDIAPKDHPNLAGWLNNLSNGLQRRFDRTGRMEDLEEAIRKIQQAVDITPENHPDLAIYLNSMGSKFESRFTRTERIEDLEEAIRRAQQAVNITPENHPDLASRLNNLGNKLEGRFERTGRMEDLEEAIRKAQQAVNVTPENHSNLAMYLTNLSNLLGSRFEEKGKWEDLEEAIRRIQQAVNIIPKDHSNLAATLNSLGNKFEIRFKRTGKMEDLEEAIRRTQQAVDIAPKDHPDLAGWLNNLGYKFSLSSQPSHRAQALECLLKSWNCLNGIPFRRVASAIQAIRLLKERSNWSEALVIAKQAVQLLPLINNRSLSRQDQQHVVSRFSGLAADACSLSLQASDDAFGALELLELGRGVIMGMLIDDRSDISTLKRSQSEKAATYDRLRNEVNAPIHEIEVSDLRQNRMTRHLQAVKDLDECILDIRELPEHRRFLLGPTAEELKERASEGPIVVVNITDIRSDAIIVTSSTVKSIKLPELTETDAINWIRKDLITYRSLEERGPKNKLYIQFLLWLWSKCVKIILQEVGDGRTPTSNNLSRIWWIGVGIANSLPFHAAGDHSVGSTENTFHWAISSYTPTIKALAYARERISTTARFQNDESKLLIVAMPKTPGEMDLRGVEKEVSEIQKAVESTFSYQSLIQPSAKTVLDQLRQYDVVHFACHGMPDHIDSFNSSLLLQEDGRESVDKLTVRQISDANLERAGIAYLSACSTAENRAKELVDEVIHLASGFQVAGFGHVIASMGPSDDEICLKMARGFYGRLKDDYAAGRSNRAIAVAVHDSILEIRSMSRKTPLRWAPYVHLGA